MNDAKRIRFGAFVVILVVVAVLIVYVGMPGDIGGPMPPEAP